MRRALRPGGHNAPRAIPNIDGHANGRTLSDLAFGSAGQKSPKSTCCMVHDDYDVAHLHFNWHRADHRHPVAVVETRPLQPFSRATPTCCSSPARAVAAWLHCCIGYPESQRRAYSLPWRVRLGLQPARSRLVVLPHYPSKGPAGSSIHAVAGSQLLSLAISVAKTICNIRGLRAAR